MDVLNLKECRKVKNNVNKNLKKLKNKNYKICSMDKHQKHYNLKLL